MRKLSAKTLVLIGSLVAAVALIGFVVTTYLPNSANGKPLPSKYELADIPFNGERAYEYLQRICAIGPRPSGSSGMAAQQELLVQHFQALGAQVEKQSFRVRHPLDGTAVTLTNLIVRFHPETSERILLCAHYDTRPYPDRDKRNPRGVFIGANDGGSGVAVLMELGAMIGDLDLDCGVDFVLFDAEEFVFNEGDTYFLGSDYFARDYVANRGGLKYRWGVLLDMVGDADLQVYQERNSVSWRDTRPLVKSIWATAKRLRVREFADTPRFEIRDDHIKLRDVGGIPTCDVIDFDYPYWHTEGDTPDKCSALSLAKVGWVVLEWLKKEGG